MTLVRGPWTSRGGAPTPLEKQLRASLQQLGIEVPAAEAAESEVVPVPDSLARVSPAFNLQITSISEAFDIASKLCKTSFVPTAYRGKPEEALAAILMGGEMGLGPMQALQGIAVINGRPTVWGDTALALVQVHPSFDGHVETFNADRSVATCVVKRKGRPDVVRMFSMQDAAKAGLLNKRETPWQTYPHRMLQMRARAWALRDQFADALRGLQIREEVLDYDHVTGAVTVANDVPVSPREVAAVVVQPVATPQPVAAPVPETTEVRRVAVVPTQAPTTGADFVIKSGKNTGRKMGSMGDDAIRWYADDCKDPLTREAAAEVRRQRVAFAAARAQQAQEQAQAEEQPTWDPETGEVHT